MFLVYYLIFRRMGAGPGGSGGMFSIGKSRAKIFGEKNKLQVTFKDVAGLDGAKEEVQEIVDFLKNADKYTKLGGKIPKGVRRYWGIESKRPIRTSKGKITSYHLY